MRNINDSNLEGEDLQEALGEIDSNLGDINDVNDSMEEAMNKETNKNKVEVSLELIQNIRNIIEVANGRIHWKTEELLPVGMIIKQLDDILKRIN